MLAGSRPRNLVFSADFVSDAFKMKMPLDCGPDACASRVRRVDSAAGGVQDHDSVVVNRSNCLGTDLETQIVFVHKSSVLRDPTSDPSKARAYSQGYSLE